MNEPGRDDDPIPAALGIEDALRRIAEGGKALGERIKAKMDEAFAPIVEGFLRELHENYEITPRRPRESWEEDPDAWKKGGDSEGDQQ